MNDFDTKIRPKRTGSSSVGGKKDISSVDSPTRKKNANPIPISKHKAPAKPADVAIAVSGVRYGAESL